MCFTVKSDRRFQSGHRARQPEDDSKNRPCRAFAWPWRTGTRSAGSPITAGAKAGGRGVNPLWLNGDGVISHRSDPPDGIRAFGRLGGRPARRGGAGRGARAPVATPRPRHSPSSCCRLAAERRRESGAEGRGGRLPGEAVRGGASSSRLRPRSCPGLPRVCARRFLTRLAPLRTDGVRRRAVASGRAVCDCIATIRNARATSKRASAFVRRACPSGPVRACRARTHELIVRLRSAEKRIVTALARVGSLVSEGVITHLEPGAMHREEGLRDQPKRASPCGESATEAESCPTMRVSCYASSRSWS